MSLFSEATCLSNIRSHSASRLGGFGGGWADGGGAERERAGGGTALEAAGEKRGGDLKRCLSRSQEKEGNKSEKKRGSRMEGERERERVGAGEWVRVGG